MTGKQADDFLAWFDQEIGTETEINEIDGIFNITFFELEANEVSKCRYYENNKL